MLTLAQRAESLAEVGPVFTNALSEITARRWTFIAGPEADTAMLSRDDGMCLAMLPGWCEHAQRFEFTAYAQLEGRVDTPARLGLVPTGTPPLRIQVTMRPNLERTAADVVRRLVQPYEAIFGLVKSHRQCWQDGSEAQRRTVERITGLTGAVQRRSGEDIALAADVGGVSLPLRVAPDGAIELGRTAVSDGQLVAIVAGLRHAAGLRPAAGNV